MNDTVESIYAQMFAPNPIPQKVVELFDKTNFYASRIDAPKMHPAMLALIAAIAQDGKPIKKPTQVPKEIDTTEETASDENEDMAENETRTASEPPLEPGFNSTPTGPMDAPAKPETLNIGRQQEALMRLSVPELRAHSKDFYRWNPPPRLAKEKIVEGILKKQPVKTGYNESVKDKLPEDENG